MTTYKGAAQTPILDLLRGGRRIMDDHPRPFHRLWRRGDGDAESKIAATVECDHVTGAAVTNRGVGGELGLIELELVAWVPANDGRLVISAGRLIVISSEPVEAP